jgi:hypothetical protein
MLISAMHCCRLCEPRRAATAPDNSLPPWMQTLLKLQIIMLAKMQWDARQRPDLCASAPTHPWPSKALRRAVPQLRSSCVAGDLLQQRAPGLLTHARLKTRLVEAHSGRRWEEVEDSLCQVSPKTLGTILDRMSHLLGAVALSYVAAKVQDGSAPLPPGEAHMSAPCMAMWVAAQGLHPVLWRLCKGCVHA